MTKIFISSRIGEERLPSHTTGEIVMGKAHYSWKIVERMYRSSLQRCDADVRQIACPDIYQDPIALRLINCSPGDIHLCVKPIELIRPLFGCRNFFVSGWEFEEIPDSFGADSPVYNFAHILRNADRIICWSSFTAENLRKVGVREVSVLPPPVFEFVEDAQMEVLSRVGLYLTQFDPAQPNKQGTLRKFIGVGNTIFCMVLNPYDHRKNMVRLMQEFAEATLKISSIRLVIKLVIDNVQTTTGNVIEILAGAHNLSIDCDQIMLIGDNLSPGEMTALFRLSDFYLCSSSTEGLNIPLIEAMATGCLPIATDKTAMADYIDANYATVLASDHEEAKGKYSALGKEVTLSHYPPLPDTMHRAVIAAFEMPTEVRKRRSELARAVVRRKFGLQAFREGAAQIGLIS